MITYSVIQKSQLEGSHRLDAEYYQPEYLSTTEKFKNFQTKGIGEISKVVYGTTPSGGVFEKQGIPFIRSQNFSLLSIADDFVLCSKDFHEQNKKSKVVSGDILFAAVGATIGQVSVIQKNIGEANINQNIAAVKIRDERFNPYFVGLFFASHFGQLQIERLVTGNAQFYLNSEQIRNFVVPILNKKFQDKIAEIIQNVQKELENSKSLYSQAEELYLKELGLKDYKIDDELFCVVNFSETKNVHRIDAEYFQSKYEKLMLKIKKQNVKLLGDLVSLKKGIEPGGDAYQDEGKLFIRVSSISKNGLIDKDQKYLSDELYQNMKKDFEPKIGEILLTKDATPGTAYVLKEKVEGIVSGGIMRLKVKEDIDAEYLTLCVNSLVGQMQIERDSGGSIIEHWKPAQIKNLQIPVLPKSVQQKIADFVHQSHESRKKAKQLLEEAKQKVEKIIEG
ncbi:MAG: restriction endonuclease subunit S [bacterium]